MSDERPQRCETCRFWVGKVGGIGACRRHAPRPGATVDAGWPKTLAQEWCGEWAPPPVVQKAAPPP